MKVITAPEEYKLQDGEVSVFIAGGITNCHNWQVDVIKELEKELSLNIYNDLVVFNPRRENFPIDRPSAAYEQIEWEYNQLNNMDIFSMYFCEGESDQPICMYELGRYIAKMQTRFPIDWEHRIIISVESGYKRKQDVITQVGLACGNKINVTVQPCADMLMAYHTSYISNAFHRIKRGR